MNLGLSLILVGLGVLIFLIPEPTGLIRVIGGVLILAGFANIFRGP